VIEEHEAVSSEASEDRPATAGHYTPKKRSA